MTHEGFEVILLIILHPVTLVPAGNAELREVIDKAQERSKLYGTRTILFVKDVREALNWAV